MSNETIITVRGFAGTTPMLQATARGDGRTQFRIGSRRSHRGADGEWVESPAVWFTVKVWGALAGKVSQSVRQGTPLLVRGRIEEENWVDKDGNPRTSQVLRADTVAIDLSSGQVTYVPPRRAGQTGAEAARSDGSLSSEVARARDGGINYNRAGEYAGGGNFEGSFDVSSFDVTNDAPQGQEGSASFDDSGLSVVPDALDDLAEAPF